MNRVMSFVHLDFITVKPYFAMKNLAIFSGVALSMLISSGTSIGAISMLMMYAALYASYPFAVGEQNGIDALYTTLSIKRSTVVLGRYIFAIIIDVCAGLLAYIFTFIVLTIMQKDFNAAESFLSTIVILLIYSVIQAVQLPIYFKLGYAKAKLLAYLPFIGLAFIVVVGTNFIQDRFSASQIRNFFGWFVENPLIATILCTVIWGGIMVISYQISLSYYRKRDF